MSDRSRITPIIAVAAVWASPGVVGSIIADPRTGDFAIDVIVFGFVVDGGQVAAPSQAIICGVGSGLCTRAEEVGVTTIHLHGATCRGADRLTRIQFVTGASRVASDASGLALFVAMSPVTEVVGCAVCIDFAGHAIGAFGGAGEASA